MADEETPETRDPWSEMGSQLEQMGVDPNGLTAGEVHNALNIVGGLSNRNFRDGVMQDLLGDDLPEGMTMAEARAALAGFQADQQADPYEGLFGDVEETQVSQGQPIDPDAIKSAVQGDVRQQIAEAQEQMRQEILQDRQVQEFNGAISRITQENGLTAEDTQFLVAQAAHQAQQDPSAAPGDAVNTAWESLNNWRTQAANQQLAEQVESNPGTTTPDGQPVLPTDGPPSSLEEAHQAMIEQMNAETGGIA